MGGRGAVRAAAAAALLLWAAAAGAQSVVVYSSGTLPSSCYSATGRTSVYYKTGASEGWYYCLGGTWTPTVGVGAGTVTNTGTLTANRLIIGNGSTDVTALGSAGTTTTLLHGNASGAPTFGAVDLSADVTGNLGVTHLAGGSGASSTTYWRGDGSWATPSGGGGSGGGSLVLLAKQTASSSASLNFTTRDEGGYTGALFQSDFDEYVIRFWKVIPATDGAHFAFRVSHDGGSTWASASGSYFYSVRWVLNQPSAGQYNDASVSSTYATLGDTIDANTNTNLLGVDGDLSVYTPSAADKMKWMGRVQFATNANWMAREESTGWHATASAVDAVQFFMSSGNIASGTIAVYGVCKTSCGGGSGQLAQAPVLCSSTAAATGTGRIPNDDTVPQNTEGDEYLTCAITPTSASSTLVITATLATSCSAGATNNMALFQDSTAGALAAALGATSTAADWYMPITLAPYTMTAGTTSSTTFKLRASCNTGTMTVNGFGSGRVFGAIPKSSMVIYEYLP